MGTYEDRNEKPRCIPSQTTQKSTQIYYPNKISNENLYKVTKEKPISNLIIESQWRLFGHILRRHEDIPANKSMIGYFKEFGNRFVGKPKTTLPILLNNELTNSNPSLSLKSANDLDHLRSLAQNRKCWNRMTRQIVKVAEASPSSLEEPDAESL